MYNPFNLCLYVKVLLAKYWREILQDHRKKIVITLVTLQSNFSYPTK